MDGEVLRKAADMLHDAADHADDPVKPNAAFNWTGLISLLVALIPQIITLFGGQPAPAPPAPPVQPPFVPNG